MAKYFVFENVGLAQKQIQSAYTHHVKTRFCSNKQ
jgi:hypothetical protein